MDVYQSAGLRHFAVAVLAASCCAAPLVAAEATHGARPASTVVFSTDAVGEGASIRPAGAELVIRTAGEPAHLAEQAVYAEDAETGAAVPHCTANCSQGPLTVVANAPSEGLAACKGQTPRVVASVATEQDAPAPLSSEETAGALLAQAHQLSLTAASEAEYSQIVRWCAESLRTEPADDVRTFAVELSAWALNRRGQLRSDQGERELGLADFDAALTLSPECWRALHNRGVSLAQSGRFADAFDDMSRVIQFNPSFAKAFSNRATLYVQAGDVDSALADYQEALELDPTLAPALVGHARVCHVTGRRDEALASFNTVIDLTGGDAEIFCSRGDLFADLGQYEEALADYAAAIKCDPQFEHAYRNGSWLLATCPVDEIRDAEGALAGAQKALLCGYGERHAALDTLAAAQANAGQFDEAIKTLQQAIEVAPEQATEAYLARKQLYESRQPFRTQPVTGEVETAKFVDSTDQDDAPQATAGDGGGLNRAGYIETF